MEPDDRCVPPQILSWCEDNRYTDPFYETGWWAFPPWAVMAVPLPIIALIPSDEMAIDPETGRPLRLRDVRFANLGLLLTNAIETLDRVGQEVRQFQASVRPEQLEAIRGLAAFASRIGVQSFSWTGTPGNFLSSRPLTVQFSSLRELQNAFIADERFRLSNQDHLAPECPPDLPVLLGNFQAEAIHFLETRYQMPRAIAFVRLQEFCGQHQRSIQDVVKMLQHKTVIVKHGVLCCGKGFSQERSNRIYNRYNRYDRL